MKPQFRVNPIQAIITSYRFNCCGVITEWRAFVEGSGLEYDQVYTISFQVWRPNSLSPVDTDGCYNRVGVNFFPFNRLADPDKVIINGTVTESVKIEVQPGDVVGFYLESSRGNTDGIQFAGDSDSNHTNETVWYGTGFDAFPTTGSRVCPFPVGPNRTLSSSTSRAPLITVTLGESLCV